MFCATLTATLLERRCSAALPVFSVDTEGEAQPPHPHKNGPQDWFVLNEFSGKAKDLEHVTNKFRVFYARMKKAVLK